MFKNIFENVSPFVGKSREKEIKKSIREKQEEQKRRGITRREAKDEKIDLAKRNFVKRGLMATAALGAAMYIPDIPEGIGKMSDKINDFFDREEDDSQEPTKEQVVIDEKDEEVFDRLVNKEVLEKIKKRAHEYKGPETRENDDEEISLEKELSFANEKIELDAEKIQDSLRGEWLDYYGVGGRGHNDLINAYSKMQAYIDDFRIAFQKEGVPQEYLYLAIPESHFDFNARSPVGAVGAYQFTIQTAEEVGLAKTIKDSRGKILKVVFDHRKDLVKSAEACAKYLRKKYDQCGDWRLAVAAYNGIVGRYFLAEKDSDKRDYNSFVEFIEDDLNKKKASVEGDYYEYEVKNGNYLSGIARFFRIDINLLKKVNGIPENSSNIKIGQILKIKLETTEQRIALFESLANIKGLGENFNYPAKFEAVWQLIKEAESSKLGKNPLIRDEVVKQAKLDRDKKGYYTYTVKGGETLYSIAGDEKKKYKLKISTNDFIVLIKKENNLRSNNIITGQKLKIPKKV